MKQIFYIIATAVAGICLAGSCAKQDDTYKEFVKIGGYNYPAKSKNLKATAGYNRVILTWDIPLDPAAKHAKVFWDNYKDSVSIEYSACTDGQARIEIRNLEDRSYTFDVINYDDAGNKSLACELTTSAYGDGWLSTHSERKVISTIMNGEDGVAKMGEPTNEMVLTKFRYLDTDGNWVESEPVSCTEFEARLPKALKGKRIQYKSAYCPENGIDTVWASSWIRTSQPIIYALSGDWTVKCTANQARNDDYSPYNMFDGDFETRYYSSTNTNYRKLFPKIVTIDTKREGKEAVTITGINVTQHPTTNASRYVKAFNVYVGDEPFDANDADYLADFGTPIIDATLVQTSASQSRTLTTPVSGRYIAIVFKNSYSSNGYIDVWEFEILGYIEAEAD